MNTNITKWQLRDSLHTVYKNYSYSGSTKLSLEKIKNLVWNAIMHIFGQSEWQIASKQLASCFLVIGSKNRNYFPLVVFPNGLRKDIFTNSEAREAADLFLNLMIKKGKDNKPFGEALLRARDRVERCLAEVLAKKVFKNPEMFPELDLKSDNFLRTDRKTQLKIIFRDTCQGITPLRVVLHTIAQHEGTRWSDDLGEIIKI